MTDVVSSPCVAKDQDLLLFGLESSRRFAGLVGQELGLTLSPHEEREFEDGEHKTRPLMNVRGRDVFVLHSLYGEPAQSANDKLCRLLFFIGALQDAAAARVTAIVPYLAYARKDRKSKARDPVTTRYVAALFEAVGVDDVLTVDVHNLAAFQNAFRCRTEHLEATGLFVAHFASRVGSREVVVVSPDAGGIKRAEQFRHQLSKATGRPVGSAFTEKHRSNDIVSGGLLVGDVRGKDAIIIDDLISSGTTLRHAAESCRQGGAARVFGAATHGLFTGDAAANLASNALDELILTDTVPAFRLEGKPAKAKLTVLSCAGLVAQAITRLHAGGSITELDAF